MKHLVNALSILLLPAAAVAQQPSANAAVNAASYAVAGLPNAGLAQGSIFIVFGTNMGPSTIQYAPSFPLQTSLAGTSISITVAGTMTQAIMIYTQANQLAAVLPSKTPTGDGSLSVTFNGQTSAPLDIEVVSSSFGAFTTNQAGTGPGIVKDGNNNLITALQPATPGQTVVLWGTGLGAIAGDETEPPAQGNLNGPVEVFVGASPATVVYHGRAGCCAGLDQVNFVVPAGQLGCSVQVSVKTGNVVSNFSTMAVSSSGPCSDALGFPPGALQQLTNKGSLNIAALGLSRFTTPQIFPPPPPATTTTETGSAAFLHFTPATVNQVVNSVVQTSIGGCSVSTYSSSSPPSGGGAIAGLDAGASIDLKGPNGDRTLAKIPSSAGLYGGSLSQPGGPYYITQGSYTFTGPGGADVGAFQASLTIGQPLTWLNQGSLSTIDRSKDLTLTWSGGPPNGYVVIIGTSTQNSGKTGLVGFFYCIAPVAPGQFTIPSAVLLSLPVTSVIMAGPFSETLGSLALGDETFASFSPPSGIDFAGSTYIEWDSIITAYQ